MPQGGELARDRAGIEAVAEELVEKAANIVTTRLVERPGFAQRDDELLKVTPVGGDGDGREAFFDAQVVHERSQGAGVCVERHRQIMTLNGTAGNAG